MESQDADHGATQETPTTDALIAAANAYADARQHEVISGAYRALMVSKAVADIGVGIYWLHDQMVSCSYAKYLGAYVRMSIDTHRAENRESWMSLDWRREYKLPSSANLRRKRDEFHYAMYKNPCKRCEVCLGRKKPWPMTKDTLTQLCWSSSTKPSKEDKPKSQSQLPTNWERMR